MARTAAGQFAEAPAAAGARAYLTGESVAPTRSGFRR